MSRFPTAGASRLPDGPVPGQPRVGREAKVGRARNGNAALRTALCEAAWASARTRDTYMAAQFRRFCRRFGKRAEGKAIFAVAHTLVVIVWHVLANDCDYQELGPDYFEGRNDAAAHARRLIRQLERFGHHVIVQPAA